MVGSGELPLPAGRAHVKPMASDPKPPSGAVLRGPDGAWRTTACSGKTQ